MGIDSGFVGEDLARCYQAKCAEHRQTWVGLARQEDGQLLEVCRLDTPTVQLEAPEYYRPTGQLDRDHFVLVGHQEKVVVEPAEEGVPGELLTQTSQGGCFRYALIPQGVIGRGKATMMQRWTGCWRA